MIGAHPRPDADVGVLDDGAVVSEASGAVGDEPEADTAPWARELRADDEAERDGIADNDEVADEDEDKDDEGSAEDDGAAAAAAAAGSRSTSSR